MKVQELFITEENIDDEEFPNLKDLSKHKYNLKLWVDESHLNKISGIIGTIIYIRSILLEQRVGKNWQISLRN